MIKPKKVALAYSGGLDTSVIIPWLKENYGCEVVAVCGDIGQGEDELTGLEAKARKTGAAEVFIEDMREEFVSQYLWKLVRSGGVYEHKYLLGTPIAQSATKIYSRDRNIWHISHEGGALEDPANGAPDDIWMLTKSPADAPDRPGEVAIAFEKGVPVSVNGIRMKAFELLESLNRV